MPLTNRTKAVSILAMTACLAAGAVAQNPSPHSSCQSIGGMLMTNLGAVDDSTTMGPATGDLKGSAGATILSSEVLGNNLVLHVQHHWVTETGDTLAFDPATATTTPVAPGLYAIVSYPVHLKGGTGKFAGATGNMNVIGEVDLNSGELVFRYSGKVCFAK